MWTISFLSPWNKPVAGRAASRQAQLHHNDKVHQQARESQADDESSTGQESQHPVWGFPRLQGEMWKTSLEAEEPCSCSSQPSLKADVIHRLYIPNSFPAIRFVVLSDFFLLVQTNSSSSSKQIMRKASYVRQTWLLQSGLWIFSYV